MTFDKSWDDLHADREWGVYPKEELVRFVATNYYMAKPRSDVRFLDLGCGAGAAVRYLIAEGFAVTGVDASKAAIDRLTIGLSGDADLICEDVTKVWPKLHGLYHCILDIACLQHIPEAEARDVVRMVHDRLMPGGRMFSVMATPGTYTSMAHPGTRFTTKRDVLSIYSMFDNIRVGYTTRHIPDRGVIQEWIVEAHKL